MSGAEKPHKGSFTNWQRQRCSKEDGCLGYYYIGFFVDHPTYGGRTGHTSGVVKETPQLDGSIEIETYNSRYTLK